MKKIGFLIFLLFSVAALAQNEPIKAGTVLDLEYWFNGVSVEANAEPHTLVLYTINKTSGERCQLSVDLTFPAPLNTKAPLQNSTFNSSLVQLVGVGNEIMCSNNVRYKIKGHLMCAGHTVVPVDFVTINKKTGAFVSAKTGDCTSGKFLVAEDLVVKEEKMMR